jgi:hypothetical protein
MFTKLMVTKNNFLGLKLMIGTFTLEKISIPSRNRLHQQQFLQQGDYTL